MKYYKVFVIRLCLI